MELFIRVRRKTLDLIAVGRVSEVASDLRSAVRRSTAECNQGRVHRGQARRHVGTMGRTGLRA